MPRLYREWGGLWWGKGEIGTINASWPFARLSAFPTQVEIRVLFPLAWRRFVLKRGEVRLIHKQRGLWSTGVRFEHNSAAAPGFLLFWTFAPDTLLRRLGELGYPVPSDSS